MNYRKKTLSVLLLLAVFLLAGGCNSSHDALSTQTVSPSDTAKPTLTATPQPTFTPSLTTTPIPSLTSSPTSSPTLTLVPTLVPYKIDSALQDLISTNGDCTLPCWWGITPGETTWAEAENFLLQYDQKMASTTPLKITIDDQNYISIIHSFTLKDNRVRVLFDILDGRDMAIIEIIDQTNSDLFILENLLSVYGKPDEIFVKTMGAAPADTLPFYILLYYPDQYFSVAYSFSATRGLPTTPKSEVIVGCVERRETPRIWTWSPEEGKYTNGERVRQWAVGVGSPNTFKNLEEVTDVDIETFYETFKEPSGKSCIETPAKFWPYY